MSCCILRCWLRVRCDVCTHIHSFCVHRKHQLREGKLLVQSPNKHHGLSYSYGLRELLPLYVRDTQDSLSSDEVRTALKETAKSTLAYQYRLDNRNAAVSETAGGHVMGKIVRAVTGHGRFTRRRQTGKVHGSTNEE